MTGAPALLLSCCVSVSALVSLSSLKQAICCSLAGLMITLSFDGFCFLAICPTVFLDAIFTVLNTFNTTATATKESKHVHSTTLIYSADTWPSMWLCQKIKYAPWLMMSFSWKGGLFEASRDEFHHTFTWNFCSFTWKNSSPTWRAGSSCSNFFLRKQLHIWKLVPYMGVVCAFWIILIICACVFAKFPALLGGLALPVAFIWKTTQLVYPRSRVTRSGTSVRRASSVLI